MHLTLVVTIDPVKDLSHLVILIHALNLQTRRDFDVVFYNQTVQSTADILARLGTVPAFPYRSYSIPREDLLGTYPIWDLYAFLGSLVEHEQVGDYLMSLHMEEFPDVDYVEHLLEVLETNSFDILFGNLSRTRATCRDLAPIRRVQSAAEFDAFLSDRQLKRSPHWAFGHRPVLWHRDPRQSASQATLWLYFGLRKRFVPTAAGYTPLRRYVAEDVYAMKVEFARRCNWFLSGHHLYFEDIHVCRNRSAGNLEPLLRARTKFPVYFNRRKLYHLRHGRFYYQIEDETFTSMFLARQVEDPGLQALQAAIRGYRSGKFTLEQALTFSRRNAEGTGSQDLNIRYHLRSLEKSTMPRGNHER